MRRQERNWILIAGLIFFCWTFGIWKIPPLTFEESLLRRMAEEMKQSRNFFELTWDGHTYANFSPAYVWCMVAAGWLVDGLQGRMSSLASRIPSLLAVFSLLALLAFWWRRLVFALRTALFDGISAVMALGDWTSSPAFPVLLFGATFVPALFIPLISPMVASAACMVPPLVIVCLQVCESRGEVLRHPTRQELIIEASSLGLAVIFGGIEPALQCFESLVLFTLGGCFFYALAKIQRASPREGASVAPGGHRTHSPTHPVHGTESQCSNLTLPEHCDARRVLRLCRLNFPVLKAQVCTLLPVFFSQYWALLRQAFLRGFLAPLLGLVGAGGFFAFLGIVGNRRSVILFLTRYDHSRFSFVWHAQSANFSSLISLVGAAFLTVPLLLMALQGVLRCPVSTRRLGGRLAFPLCWLFVSLWLSRTKTDGRFLTLLPGLTALVVVIGLLASVHNFAYMRAFGELSHRKRVVQRVTSWCCESGARILAASLAGALLLAGFFSKWLLEHVQFSYKFEPVKAILLENVHIISGAIFLTGICVTFSVCLWKNLERFVLVCALSGCAAALVTTNIVLPFVGIAFSAPLERLARQPIVREHLGVQDFATVGMFSPTASSIFSSSSPLLQYARDDESAFRSVGLLLMPTWISADCAQWGGSIVLKDGPYVLCKMK